jgi:hypothetical protein
MWESESEWMDANGERGAEEEGAKELDVEMLCRGDV